MKSCDVPAHVVKSETPSACGPSQHHLSHLVQLDQPTTFISKRLTFLICILGLTVLLQKNLSNLHTGPNSFAAEELNSFECYKRFWFLICF